MTAHIVLYKGSIIFQLSIVIQISIMRTKRVHYKESKVFLLLLQFSDFCGSKLNLTLPYPKFSL